MTAWIDVKSVNEPHQLQNLWAGIIKSYKSGHEDWRFYNVISEFQFPSIPFRHSFQFCLNPTTIIIMQLHVAICNRYNMSGVLYNIYNHKPKASDCRSYTTETRISDLSYPQIYKIKFYYNFQDTSKFGRENQSQCLCKWRWFCIRNTSSATVMIYIVFSSWIINEYDKYV